MEKIKLNIVPSGANPTCYASQYDAGRVIRLELFDGLTPYTIKSGDTFTLNVRKPDNTIVTTSVTGTQGNNYIDITTTEQICACVGFNLCDLTITNGATKIGTLNFIMSVERDVLADGIPSESVIEDLDERIAEAIGDDYYNKTETDALLALKADKSTTYTKTETDNLLAAKANTEDVEDALALKADKSELYSVYPTEQESGALANFTDGADNILVKSLVSQIVAVESGSGEKSPDNPYTISGFNSGVVSVCGKNLIGFPNVDFTIANMRFYSDGTAIKLNGTSTSEISSLNTNFKDNFAFTLPAGDYYASANSPNGVGLYLRRYSDNTMIINALPSTFTLTEPTKIFWGIYVPNNKTLSDHNTQFNITKGDIATTYEAYNGNTYTFTFGQTVYGGHFDNKGNLVVTHKIVDMGSIDWNYLAVGDFYVFGYQFLDKAQNSNEMCSCYKVTQKARQSLLNYELGTYNLSNALNYVTIRDDDYTDATAFKTAMNGQKLVYELATPITLAITSQDIPTLLGVNNIFSDTGDVDVIYRADIGLYIDKRLNANRSTPNLERAALSVDNTESTNEPQENNEER